MKNMKKCFSILLVLVMVFALTATAMAADTTTYSITIENSAPNHVYEAYQIFTGVLTTKTTPVEGEEGKTETTTVLSDIAWGSSVSNASELGDASKIAERLNTGYAGTDKLSIDDLMTMVQLGAAASSTSTVSEGNYVISGLTAGYYLVKDKDGSLTDKDDSYTEYIVKVLNNVTTKPKGNKPKVEKKVKDANDTDGTVTDWKDSADHDITDHVSFQLKATLANNVTSYDKYKVIFNDTMSKGLTYDGNAKVYINDKETDGFAIESEKDAGTGETKLTISCDDVRVLSAGNSAVITVEYTAELNSDAVYGKKGNPNEVYLVYSNNPNNSEGGTDDDTGKTPPDKVIVFTYKTIIDKVDQNGDPLSGAEFTLTKKQKDGTWKDVTVVKGEGGTVFTMSGLDDGFYCLTETAHPEGYNSIDPVYFIIEAEHDLDADDPELTKLVAYRANEDGTKQQKDNADIDFGVVTLTDEKSEIEAEIENRSGSTLPETGGMGTTILYIAGGVLVAAAAVMLIVKRRMAVEK